MNVTNFSNLFHQDTIFQRQQNRLLGQPPVQTPLSDVLNRMSENLLSAEERAKDLKTRFDTLELSAEAADHSTALSKMPEGLLRVYLSRCINGASLSRWQGASLEAYRDQLSAFDQTIQEYQEMLDGKAALPEYMKQEDVSSLLEAAKAARETFLQKGAEGLNAYSKLCGTPKENLGRAYEMLTDEEDRGRGGDCWQIDASAEDIYEEIDQAIASVRRTSLTYQKGASAILKELKRRGLEPEETEFILEDWGPDMKERARNFWVFQPAYEELWNTFQPNAGAKDGE